MPSLSDAELVQRCLDGDELAYGELLERYQDRAYWTAMKFVRNAEDAADVVQEAFIKAFAQLERFDQERAYFTWMYRIVVNVAIDFIRKRDLRQAGTLDELNQLLPDESALDPLEAASQGELEAQVHGCLETLPELYRSVLVLTEIEGLTCKEVGEILEVPHATARWRLHHARKLFKDVWERRVLKIGEEQARPDDA